MESWKQTEEQSETQSDNHRHLGTAPDKGVATGTKEHRGAAVDTEGQLWWLSLNIRGVFENRVWSSALKTLMSTGI